MNEPQPGTPERFDSVVELASHRIAGTASLVGVWEAVCWIVSRGVQALRRLGLAWVSRGERVGCISGAVDAGWGSLVGYVCCITASGLED